MNQGIENRILILILVFIAIGLLVWGRFFYLMVVRHDYYLAKAKILTATSSIEPRGSVYLTDKDNLPLAAALNKEFSLVYASPVKIKNPEDIAKKLAPILEIDEAILLEKLKKANDPYEILKRKVSDEIVNSIKALNETGINIADETLRYYPNGLYLSHITGFLGFNKDGQLAGQYGLEEFYDKELSGTTDSSDLVLTIDSAIQAQAGIILDQLIFDWRASGGSIIVMNPKNGEILAMISLPDFDANKYSETKNKSIFMNPATLRRYEPGSVFKPITMAIGIETGAITPETKYYNSGTVTINGKVISNSLPDKILGWQSMTMVLEQSLNTGAIFIEEQVPKNVFLKYLKDFGINGKTGVDVAEISGDLSVLSSGRDINFATASFGQGVAVTPLGLIRALAAIANGGKLVKPHLVSKIISRSGEIYEEGNNEAPKQVISAGTSAKLINMMIKVIENGSGRQAQVPGYTIAGKTGTAQVPDLQKGGYKDEYIHTFVAFAPAYDPKFIALIKLDNPRGVRFAENTVVPVFKDLAKFIFSYYQIPPDKPVESAQ
jgi:cell division protein FtsI (penicillin-binding protein 3)/stage V sporulation protein D (sporulation-specific penicillin-binding protein)